jgi:hypothetical protein
VKTNNQEINLVVKSNNGYWLYLNGKYTGVKMEDGVLMDSYIERKYPNCTSLIWA